MPNPSESHPSAVPTPSTASARQLLEQRLRTDEDLDAFCIDCFLDVYHRFAHGMDRTAKINLLLTLHEPQAILEKLNSRAAYPLAQNLEAGESTPKLRWTGAAIGVGLLAIASVALSVSLRHTRIAGQQDPSLPVPAPVPVPAPAPGGSNSHPPESTRTVDTPSAVAAEAIETTTDAGEPQQATLAEAQVQYDLRHFDAVLKLAEKVFAKEREPEALFLMAQAHRKLGNMAEAKERYDAYLKKKNIQNRKMAREKLKELAAIEKKEEELANMRRREQAKPEPP
jgi:tetratricopeptide (TPR) repeat protein